MLMKSKFLLSTARQPLYQAVACRLTKFEQLNFCPSDLFLIFLYLVGRVQW